MFLSYITICNRENSVSKTHFFPLFFTIHFRKTERVVKVTVGTLFVLCLLGLAIGLGLYAVIDVTWPFGPPSISRLGTYRTAAVSSDGVPCSTIGR